MPFVDGHLEPSVDFPYDEIDGEFEPQISTAPKESDQATIGKIFLLLLTYGGSNPSQFFITANVLAFVLGLHPNQAASGEIIAAGLRMKKAAWFRRVNQMRKVLEQRGAILPHIAGEWSKSARKSIKATTTQSHEKTKNTKIAKATISRICNAFTETRRSN